MSLLEKIKEPPIALSLSNTAIILLASAYFNKRISELEENFANLNSEKNKLIQIILEMKKKNSEQDEILTLIKKKINTLDKKISSKNIENISEEVKEIISVLEEKGINIKTENNKKSSLKSSKKREEDSDYQLEPM